MTPMFEGLALLFALMAAHALCDYPLQGDFLAKAKNHKDPMGKTLWVWCLPAHASIHGGAVLILTGSVGLALADTVVHGVIDFLKNQGLITFGEDQTAHVLWRGTLWVFIAAIAQVGAIGVVGATIICLVPWITFLLVWLARDR